MPQAIHNSNSSHRTMQVVNHVRALIENGTLQPGDKISPEREFGRTLKISRASLHTGIGYLAAMGVMKIRHGVGTFVADRPPAGTTVEHPNNPAIDYGPCGSEYRQSQPCRKKQISQLKPPGPLISE